MGIKIIEDKKLDFSDVLIVPKATELSSRSEVNLEVSYICKHSKARFNGLPVVVSNMDSVGTIEMAEALLPHKCWVALHKFIDSDVIINKLWNLDNIFVSIGISNEDYNKILRISTASNIKAVNIDAANGYMYSFLDFIKRIRELLPNTIIMAGNVCTPDGVENIIKAGADIVKCGIAQGQFCETKFKAGIGYKQFSVALECGQAANELNALCCSDGGCKTPADICKALGAGSHLTMVGSLFAGHNECNAGWKLDATGNKTHMLMYGMSSKRANEKYFGGLKTYRASEGREDWIEYKGPVEQTILDIKGSLASCCTYTNTKNVENLWKNCSFTK